MSGTKLSEMQAYVIPTATAWYTGPPRPPRAFAHRFSDQVPHENRDVSDLKTGQFSHAEPDDAPDDPRTDR